MSEQDDMTRQPELSADDPGFDGMLDRLESIVVQLEKGELPLEDALERFEDGMALATKASVVLDAAELRVEKLIRERGQLVAVPLDDGA